MSDDREPGDLYIGYNEAYREAGYMIRHFSISRNAVLTVSYTVIIGSMLLILQNLGSPETNNKYVFLIFVTQFVMYVVASCLSIVFSTMNKSLSEAMATLELQGTPFGVHAKLRNASLEINWFKNWDGFTKVFVLFVGIIELCAFISFVILIV